MDPPATEPSAEALKSTRSFSEDLRQYSANIKSYGKKMSSNIQNIPNSLGLDNMTGWIQRSLYSKTSNRGALFAEWESKRRTASLIFVTLGLAGLVAALGYFFLSTDDLIEASPWDYIGSLLRYTTLVLYFCSIAAWFNLYTIKTRLHALTAFKDEEINSPNFSSRLATTGLTFTSWYKAGVWQDAILDLIILLPQPLPFATITIPVYEYSIMETHFYDLNWILTMVMFARCFFIPRTLADMSHLSSFQARAIGNLNFIGISPGFVLRAYLGQSVLAVCILFFSMIMAFAFMMLIAEHPMEDSHLRHNFPNCVWLIIITMTTVGYGDYYPQTMLGRAVAVMAAFAAVICTALFVGVVGQHITLSRQEERVVSVIDRMERSKQLRLTAAACIGRMWRAYAKRCRGLKSKVADENTPLTKKKQVPVTFDHDVAYAVSEFRDLRRNYISDLVELSNDTALSKIQFQLTVHLNKINNDVSVQSERISRLEHSINQKFVALHEALQNRS